MKWQELDAKAKRKALILAAIVGAAIMALLWPSGMWRAKPMPRVLPVRTGPQAGRGTPPPAPRPVPLPAKDFGMLGHWSSAPTALPNHGLCTLWLEVTAAAQEPDKYTGAASLSCLPTASLTAPKQGTPMELMLAARDPVSASLSGTWAKDAIVFEVVRVINPKQCGFTALTLSKFGAQNLAAEFKDECGGGSMVLRKAG